MTSKTQRESDSPGSSAPISLSPLHQDEAGSESRRDGCCSRLDKKQRERPGLGKLWKGNEHSGLGTDTHPKAEIKLVGKALRL